MRWRTVIAFLAASLVLMIIGLFGYDHFYMQEAKVCPRCGKTDDSIPIVYGKPGPELRAKADCKLGGCMVTVDSPGWYCRKCGVDWGRSRDADFLRK